MLTNAEKSANVVLLCSNRALSNVDIEVSEARNAEDIPLQQINTRICHIDTSDDTLIVRVKVLRGKALWYLAGQYATVHLPSLGTQLLPIASCPCEAGYLEFHLSPEATEVARAFAHLPKRERIVIEGPHGVFTVNDVDLNEYHHVFIAVEHRFAVIKPMIEHIIATEQEPQCTLIRVARNPYKSNLCRSWADAFDWFHYHCVSDVPSLSEVFPSGHGGKPVKVYASSPDATRARVIEWLKNRGHYVMTTDNTNRLSGGYD